MNITALTLVPGRDCMATYSEIQQNRKRRTEYHFEKTPSSFFAKQLSTNAAIFLVSPSAELIPYRLNIIFGTIQLVVYDDYCAFRLLSRKADFRSHERLSTICSCFDNPQNIEFASLRLLDIGSTRLRCVLVGISQTNIFRKSLSLFRMENATYWVDAN